jgi:hypothetical protein
MVALQVILLVRARPTRKFELQVFGAGPRESRHVTDMAIGANVGQGGTPKLLVHRQALGLGAAVDTTPKGRRPASVAQEAPPLPESLR